MSQLPYKKINLDFQMYFAYKLNNYFHLELFQSDEKCRGDIYKDQLQVSKISNKCMKKENQMDYNFKIRYIREEDLSAVYEIEKRSFLEPNDFLTLVNYLKNSIFLVAENEDEEIIGFIVGQIRYIQISKYGHVMSIAVDSEFRRRGIGTALMKELTKKFNEKNIHQIKLEVRVSNIPALNLYKKLGFKKKKIIRGYYPNGEDCYVLWLI